MSKLSDNRAEIRTKTVGELHIKINDLKRSLFNLRFRVATKDTVNISTFKKNRREIARLHTELRARKIKGVV
jgi:large subunit ribosomal protein L29